MAETPSYVCMFYLDSADFRAECNDSALLVHPRVLAGPQDSPSNPSLFLQKYSRPTLHVVLVIFAEREGFEPSRPFPACRFSKPVLSTTQPPLRILLNTYLAAPKTFSSRSPM